MGAGGNGNNQWEWEGMGLRKTFLLISSFNSVYKLSQCLTQSYTKLMFDSAYNFTAQNSVDFFY